MPVMSNTIQKKEFHTIIQNIGRTYIADKHNAAPHYEGPQIFTVCSYCRYDEFHKLVDGFGTADMLYPYPSGLFRVYRKFRG